MQKIDEAFMRRALELSLRGRGRVHPNPLVGAVLARGSRVLAEGWHARFGGPHAEVEALNKINRVPPGATLYVTLEPCAHTGKTPPCVDLILSKKVRRVVIGARDVNPLVAGRGIAALRRAGVRVETGVLADEAEDLNRDFNHWIRRGTPYVTVKAGQSVDGAIATAGGQSKWITSERSRRRAMEIRAHADAIVVGVSTVLRDDPRLTVRLPGYKGRQPLKIVLDPLLRTPRKARLFSGGEPVLLAVSPRAPEGSRRAFSGRAEIIEVPETLRGLSWNALLRALGERGIVQILIEGGGQTIGRAFDAGIVQEAHFFVAPLILGGDHAVRSVAGRGTARLSGAPRFRRVDVERIGDDLHYSGRF